MEKTIPLRMKIYGFLCALLLCLSWVPALAQECPQPDEKDVEVTIVPPNLDCNLPGELILRYVGRVAIYESLYYSVTIGEGGYPEGKDAPTPGAPVKFELPADMSAGTKITVAIRTGCSAGSAERILNLVASPKNLETVGLYLVPIPAGNGGGTSGGVQAALKGPHGITEATFYLYKKDDLNTVVARLRSTRPYEGVTFINLAVGDYVVKADAKPSCTPTTMPAHWKTDHFELESSTTIRPFNLIATGIPGRGTCTGGVTAEVSKINGVQQVEYRVAKKAEPNTVLQTATVNYPKFTHTFVGLPLGDYILSATEKTGNSTLTREFTVENDTPKLQLKLVHGSFEGLSEGELNVTLPNTTAACPVKYTLTRKDDDGKDASVPFTSMVKDNVTEETTLISGLPYGNYEVKAEYGGETLIGNIQVIHETFQDVNINDNGSAKLCEPTGEVSISYFKPRYYVTKAKIVDEKTRALIREFTIPANETYIPIKNLFPGKYLLLRKYDKYPKEDEQTFSVYISEPYFYQLSVDMSNASASLCGDKPMARVPIYYNSSNGVESDETMMNFLKGATYEIRRVNNDPARGEVINKVVATGTVPQLKGNEKSYIETPALGNRIILISRCGYPQNEFYSYYDTVNEDLLEIFRFSPEFTFRGCGGTGTDVNLRVLAPNKEPLPLITYKVKKKGTDEVVAEYAMKEGVKTAIIANMQPGDYTVEWYAQCNPTKVYTDAFRVEDKVTEIKGAGYKTDATCGDNGSISIGFTEFANINAWRHELYRASDNQLIKAYGSGSTSSVGFDNLAPGRYIVKSTPIVECGEITPGRFEVEIKRSETQGATLSLGTVIKRVTPFKNDGEASYSAYIPAAKAKWRVLDVVTGAEINKGEAETTNQKNPTQMIFRVDKLPQTYKIEVESPCGKVERVETLPLLNEKGLPGFDVKVKQPIVKCGVKGSITLNSLLKAAGLPEMGTKVELSKGSYYDKKVVAEFTNPTSIIGTHTFSDLDPGTYQVAYYYNGMSATQNVELREDATPLIPEEEDRVNYYNADGKAQITVKAINVEPGTKMKVLVSYYKYEAGENKQIKVAESVVPADQPYTFEYTRPEGEDEYVDYSEVFLNGTILDGCYAGHKFQTRLRVYKAKFDFIADRNEMLCANDGEITLRVPKAFHGVSQVHYEITMDGNDTYKEVVETKTPAIPKKVIGLQPGSYTIKARATFLKPDGDVEVVDIQKSAYLYTNYRNPLYATARPDYMVPTGAACPNGRIGLNIEGGREDNYRVYLKSTPDGEVNPMRELFTDPDGDGKGKLWGEGFKPGHYSLLVKDGCMEREIPDAEVVELPNTPKMTTYWDYMKLDERTTKTLKETRDSVWYDLRFDPSLFEENFRPIAYRAFEVQVVAKGAAPDDKQWNSNWTKEDDGRSTILGYAKRFNNCDGVDVLVRFKNCPTTVSRFPMTIPIQDAFTGVWTQLKCNTVQWTFLSGEIGHRYKIKVTRREDNVVVREKEVIFNSHEDYLQRDPDLEFPSDKGYVIEMKPLDYCGDALTGGARYVNAINHKYEFEIEDNTILSDCDGRMFSFYSWTDCKLPMKYYAYEIEGTQETLVSESGNYVPYRWAPPFKFKKDKTYSIRVVEYGQPETTQIEVSKFTLNYKLPVKYRFSSGWNLESASFCGNMHSFYSKGASFNSFGGTLEPIWADNDPYVQPYRYVTLPHMTVEATQKAAPHRKFVATRVTRYYGGLTLSEWKELLSDGTYAKDALAPDGEYTLVAKTECGDVPMPDDYIGRPVLDLKPSTVEASCDGKFTVTPKGTLTYKGSTAGVEILSFYVEGDSFNTTRNWGESFDTYQRKFTLIVNVKLKSTGRVCSVRWPFSMDDYVLAFDQSQSMSLFCEDSGKGIIHMALKGGQPPYTYKLMTPDEEELETKTVPGAVDFERGQLGQRFRIKATDNCGLSWIYQDVQIQDPAAVSASMRGRERFCEGDRAVMTARFFPNVTYEWTLPNGTKVPGRELTFQADKNSGGVYTVEIHLTTCTVTLTGRYQVGIVTLQEVDNFPTEKTGCAGESILIEAGPAKATLNGEDASNEVTYQWQTTKTPSDDNSWSSGYDDTGVNNFFRQTDPGVYYVRRKAKLGSCEATSSICKVTLASGINVAMSPNERELTIDHKNPFTLTAGIVTGNPNRTYQWQRSLDKKTWENVGTEENFTEENRVGNTVYYRRNISSEGCFFQGDVITVHFKKRRGAYINPQLRQRTYQD